MSRIPVATIDDHPKLRETFNAMMALKENFVQRQAFIKKQAEDLRKEMEEKKKPHWDAIEDTLVEMKRLPSWYNRKKHNIHLSLTDENRFGIIQIEDEQGGSPDITDLLKALIKD